jgi:hypothetical protein
MVVRRPRRCSLSSIETALGISLRDWIALQWLKYFHFNMKGVKNAIILSELSRGTFWTPQNEYWNAARHLLKPLQERSKIYEFLEQTVLPNLSRISTADLMAIKRNEEAFTKFRRDLSLLSRLIRSMPENENFHTEAEQLFHDYFRPGILSIEKSMSRSRFSKVLPLATASIVC